MALCLLYPKPQVSRNYFAYFCFLFFCFSCIFFLANTSISLGILECLPTGESQCPGVVGTGIGDSAAQEGQRKDRGDEVLNQSTLLIKGQEGVQGKSQPTSTPQALGEETERQDREKKKQGIRISYTTCFYIT